MPTSGLAAEQDERLHNLAVEKAGLEIAQAKLEGAARLEAINAKATSSELKDATDPNIEENFTSEIPKEVKTFSTQFAGFAQGEIAKIFSNKFQSMNLYKLRYLRRREDMFRNQIQIEEGSLEYREVTGTYKDHGTEIIIWSEAFYYY